MALRSFKRYLPFFLLSAVYIAAVLFVGNVAWAAGKFKPDGIIIHTSTCPGPKGFMAFKNSIPVDKNYHYTVLRNGEIKAGYPETKQLTHMGSDLTVKSLSVMVEAPLESSDFPSLIDGSVSLPLKQQEALQKLLVRLIKKHNIPLSQVERHMDHDLEACCPGNHYPFFKLLYGMSVDMIRAKGIEPLESCCQRKKISLPLSNARVVVEKSAYTLKLYQGNTLLKTYKVGLSCYPKGDKVREGDRKTPTGEFYISEKYPMRAWMELSYPDEKHAKVALKKKLISKMQFNEITAAVKGGGVPVHHTRMGADVGFHASGNPYGKMTPDYTAGCVALEDPEAFELYYAVPVGTKVVITE